MLGFSSRANWRNCCTARCLSIWYRLIIATLSFSWQKKPPSAHYDRGCESRYFLRINGHPQNGSAVEQWKRTLELDPNLLEAHLWLSKAYWTRGLYPEAISEAEKAASYSGRTPRYVAGIEYALAAAGKRAEAHNIIDELARTSKSVIISPYYIAGIYGTLGERDQALEWLEKAYQVRDYQIGPIAIDPVFGSIRSDQRYTDLLSRMGLRQ